MDFDQIMQTVTTIGIAFGLKSRRRDRCLGRGPGSLLAGLF